MTAHGPDVEQDYERSGFGGSLPWGRRPALLLVDFARGYFEDGSPLRAPVESARSAAGQLVFEARARGVPLVFTRVEYPLDKEAEPARLFRRKIAGLSCWEIGNPLGDFTPELSPLDDDLVITKQFPSAFFATDLAAWLRDHDLDTVLIAGLTTSGCVRASALDAICHGFAPLVVRDACGDRDPRVHEANLFDLSAKYADVIGIGQALDYLRSLS